MSPRLWFLPERPDLPGMLRRQVAVTVEGLDAFVAWAGGEADAAGRVREAEHRADDQRRTLRRALTDILVAPIDPEDLYVLSERLDAVMNGAKDAVREAEVMAIEPDEHIEAMARCLADGTRHLGEAFENLLDRRRPEAATESADAAVHAKRELERAYRTAASSLLEVDDLALVMAKRELYRRLARVGDAVGEVADRVWYATMKAG